MNFLENSSVVADMTIFANLRLEVVSIMTQRCKVLRFQVTWTFLVDFGLLNLNLATNLLYHLEFLRYWHLKVSKWPFSAKFE